MAIELIKDHELDGVRQNCVRWDCSCGAVRISPFRKVKNKDLSSCPECGCYRSFSNAIIEQFENELK